MFMLLLLSACAGVGLSFHNYQETYGNTHRIILPSRTESIEFLPEYKPGRIILWKHDDPQTIEDSRMKVIEPYYVIQNLTQKDNGRYLLKDKDRTILVGHDLTVEARTVEYSMRSGETFTISSVLEGTDCNIYFYPGNGPEREIIVDQGRLEYQTLCRGLTFRKPCELYCSGVESSCDGRFEFRDRYDNEAVVMHLEVEQSEDGKPYISASVGALAFMICGTCLKMCCVRTSKATSDTPEEEDEPTAYNEPASYYYENRHERFRPTTGPNRELDLPQPSAPLIHSPPTTVPSYSEIPPSAEPPSYSEVMSQDGALMSPQVSSPDQRFEVRGFTFDSAPPLSSDTAEPSVYTSEKLNFL